MDVTNAIFEEAKDDVDEEPDDFNGTEEETEKEVARLLLESLQRLFVLPFS